MGASKWSNQLVYSVPIKSTMSKYPKQNYLRNILLNSGLAGNIRLASELFRRGFLCSPWITKCCKQISSNVFDCTSRTRRLPGRQLPPLLTLTHTEHFFPPDHSQGVNNPPANRGTEFSQSGYMMPKEEM